MADVEKIAAELRAGLEGVTPGPWRMHVPDRGYCANYVLTDAPEFAPVEGKWPWKHLVADFDDCERGEINAAFVALCSPENIRALLDELDRLREANRKLHRRAQLAEAVNQSCEGILDAWCRFLRNRENRQFENTLFHMALGDIMSSRKRIAARALSEREGRAE